MSGTEVSRDLKMGRAVTSVVDPIRTFHAASLNLFISSILLVEAERSSKTFVLTYHTTGCHTSEDPNFNHRNVYSVGILKLLKL
jgi:hypothetical protein